MLNLGPSFQLEQATSKRENSVVRFDKGLPRDKSAMKSSHVYLPRLHREKTEVSPSSRLQENLGDLDEALEAADDRQTRLAAISESSERLERLVVVLRRISDIDFKSIYLVNNTPQFSQETKTIYYILPFKYERITVTHLDPGYVTFRLPKPEPGATDDFRKLRSYDEIHLSPLKFKLHLEELVHKALNKTMIEVDNENEETTDEVQVNGSMSLYKKKMNHVCETNLLYSISSFCVQLSCGWVVELIPAIFTSKKEPVYVMKPYEADENCNSDIRWRMCFAQRESIILKTICNSDKDVRISAINIVVACLQCDTRLNLISLYQIQTCLLHEMDDLMDNSPRWQRHTLETCVISLFKRILFFVSSKNLPHFFTKDFNLLEYWTANELRCATNALERICNNQHNLIKLVNRSHRSRLALKNNAINN